jgi:NADPH2:quinone reductase
VTAHLALHRRAALQPGETVLVQGGAGGVGSAAVQLAVAHGARVIATAVDDERTAACRWLGADIVVNPLVGVLHDVVMDATSGRGVDVVIDPVGGDAFDESRRCVAFEGRLVVVGFVAGRIAELRTNALVLRNFTVMGVNNGLYMATRPDVHRDARSELLRLADEGRIEPLVAGRWPFVDAPAALERLAAGQLIGKALVDVEGAE